MKYIKYFLQFIFAIITFVIFKFLGPNLSSNFSGKLFEFVGPFFRSKIIINSNIKKAIPNIQDNELNKITYSLPSLTILINYSDLLLKILFNVLHLVF